MSKKELNEANQLVTSLAKVCSKLQDELHKLDPTFKVVPPIHAPFSQVSDALNAAELKVSCDILRGKIKAAKYTA